MANNSLRGLDRTAHRTVPDGALTEPGSIPVSAPPRTMPRRDRKKIKARRKASVANRRRKR